MAKSSWVSLSSEMTCESVTFLYHVTAQYKWKQIGLINMAPVFLKGSVSKYEEELPLS